MSNNFKDMMIDIETVDILPTAVILSCACVYFDRRTGEIGDVLYGRFDIEADLNAERTQSQDTLGWWAKQGKEERLEAFSGQGSLFQFLCDELPEFYQPKVRVWGNGSIFDIAILENAMRQASLDIPWKFWDIRDVRTVMDSVTGFVTKPTGKATHNPVEDCELQIDYTCKALNFIRD